MTQYELMKSRFKVIADYPDSKLKVGDIKELDSSYGDEEGFWHGKEYWDKTYLEKFPHIFRKLGWWEERISEDMPKYLKYPNNGVVFEPYMIQPDIGRYYETEKESWDNDSNGLSMVVPATEEEFKNQK